MSHVDEGALHAYLDGALDELPPGEAQAIRAHLDGCAECADRLEAERTVRSDAHAILGLAAPEVELPSLEELRAYVKRTRPERPAGARRLYRLGWAASVMIAVGAGWMVRDGQLQQRALDRVTPARSAPAFEGEAAAAPAVAVTEPAPAGDGDERAEVQTGADVADDLPEALAAQPASLSDIADAPADAVAKGAGAQAAPSPAAAEASFVAPPSPIDPSRFEADVGPARAVSAPLAPIAITAETAGSRSAGGQAGVAAKDSTAEREERRRAQSLVPITSAMDRSGAGALRDANADDLERPDEPTLAVPGYEVVSVTNLGEGTASFGAYVVQRMDGDTLFEIFHLQPGADPSALPPLAEGAREVRLDGESGWVILRGPLQTEELEALLAQLFPGASR